MVPEAPSRSTVATYCALCTSRCGARATLEDGRFVSLAADPSHPTGKALCLKGKVAPEIVYDPGRLLHPMKRTRPKGEADPGWQRISWDEALDLAAARLNALAAAHGPETVAFNTASPSTSALSDSRHWVVRLRPAFGSPNHSTSYELCGWGRWMANLYSFGSALPAGVMPDLDRAGCILFWGYNPTVSRIAHATAAVAAKGRGAKLVVVDPRQAGLARRADEWLRVRPGTDGALALGLAHVMIARGWHDAEFLRAWTNAPALVREDTGRLLRARDLAPEAQDASLPDAALAWSEAAHGPVACTLGDADPALALSGRFEVETPEGPVACRPVFQLWSEICARHDPAAVETLTGVPADQIERTAELIATSRPLSYMTWSGLEQQANATQAALAIGLLYALTGDYDAPGGNVELPTVPAADVQGAEFLSEAQRARAVGLETRPLGPPRFEEVNSADLYRAILEGKPYPVRGLVSFGSNLALSHADGGTALEALRALEFHMHVDHTLNPSAAMADLVLPAATPFETEGLKIGFEISAEANGLTQLRRPLLAPRGEARSDARIVFDLACRMGLGHRFWDGDLDAGMRAMLAPSGIALETLRAHPEGVRTPLVQRHRKYAEPGEDGPRGFATPSRRVELFSERLMDHGGDALPDYRPPPATPGQIRHGRRFPLTLTCAKDTLFCETQHRGAPSLRRRQPDPPVDLHPQAAAARGIAEGDWVRILTPHGASQARARFDRSLACDVVCGQHGWWEPCEELGAPGYPVTGPGNANFNAMIGHDLVDPVGGSVPLRAYACDLERIDPPPTPS
tara:strand:- start:175 stop:2583 length:2409 start_codon:yes stop_codon:yes gene_type:complete